MAELVLGPLLRYAGTDEATIWVETDAACTVEVRIEGARECRRRTFEVAGHHYAILHCEGLQPDTATPYEVLLDELANGALDLGLIATSTTPAGVVHQPLAVDPFLLATSPGDELARHLPRTPGAGSHAQHLSFAFRRYLAIGPEIAFFDERPSERRNAAGLLEPIGKAGADERRAEIHARVEIPRLREFTRSGQALEKAKRFDLHVIGSYVIFFDHRYHFGGNHAVEFVA